VSRDPDWRLAPAVAGWGVAGVVVLALGVLTGRADVAVLGLPLLLGLAWSRSDRPGPPAAARLTGCDQPVAAGGLVAGVTLEPRPSSAVLSFRVTAPGHRAAEGVVRAEAPRTIGVRMDSVRTGRRDLFRLDYRVAGPDGLLTTAARSAPPLTVTVLPAVQALGDLPLPFRLQGLTGPHRSRRVGDGGEFYDLARFAPGDRMRRIDWRVTTRLNTGPARVGTAPAAAIDRLYVRRTNAGADATVMIVIDSRDDVGPRLITWADATAVREDEATSLDVARTAAASLADHYLAAGDRVGGEDLGRLRRPVPPAAGRPQLRRLVQWLAWAEPEGEPKPRRRVPRLPSGSLIIVLSTFLDDDAADLALAWRGSGHRVLAVDTLPPTNFSGATPRLRTAYRIVAMERQDRFSGLRRAGVEPFPWLTGHDPALDLAVLSRLRERR
jgi:uncharacterized protein (DUF58 family)